jgi:hypothetical protein
MMALFAGFEGAHGTHGAPTKKPDTIKWEIKTSATTLREPVTVEIWELHLAGKRPLGIITIRADGMVLWASIDYDVYDDNLLEIVERVEQLKLPLLPVRSKSGGLHLFMFFEEWVPAAHVLPVLRDISARLGIAGSEVFPRQTQVLVERGDLGNWMVMPYFGDTYGGKIQEQFGLKKTGAEMSLREFLNTAEKMKVTEKALEALVRKSGSGGASVRRGRKLNGGGGAEPDQPFGDGPPCCQTLAADGVPAGFQNNALLHMGVYYKRKYPMEWREKLEDAGRLYLSPPSTSEGMQSVIKSLEKKDYEYTCKTEPMVSHCNSALCRTRMYGVGDEGQFPTITGMSKLETDPPIWFVSVEEVQVEMNIAELRTYELFCRKVADRTNKSYCAMANKDWLKVVNVAMQGAHVLQVSETAGEGAMFMELLEEFLTNRHKGESLEDLLTGRPWLDAEQGRYYFRLRDLHSFLQREGMKENRAKVYQRIHDLHGDREYFNIKGRGIRAVWVTAQSVQEAPELAVPQTPESAV